MNSKIVRMNKKDGREQVSGLDCIRHFLLERLCVVCLHSEQRTSGGKKSGEHNQLCGCTVDQDMQIFGQVWFGKTRT
jgi:hypothetical protein